MNGFGDTKLKPILVPTSPIWEQTKSQMKVLKPIQNFCPLSHFKLEQIIVYQLAPL